MPRKQQDPQDYPLPSQDALVNLDLSNVNTLRNLPQYLQEVALHNTMPAEERLQMLLARYQRRWVNGVAYRKAWLLLMGIISGLIFLSYPAVSSLITAFFCAVLPIGLIAAVNETAIAHNRSVWQRYYAEYQHVLANLWLPQEEAQPPRQDVPEWVELDDAPDKAKRG